MAPAVRRMLLVATVGCLACEATPIVLYHGVGEPFPGDRWVTSEQFEEELNYLLEAGYTPITAPELDAAESGDLPMPDHPIVLTFDDGHQSLYDFAFPALKAHQVKATIFLTVGRIGEDSESRVLDPFPHLVWTEVLEMHASGLIDFQSHSVTHARFRDLSEDAARRELEDSKEELERRLQKKITVFAYPGGSQTIRDHGLVEAAGYESAHSVSSGLNQKYSRLRTSIGRADDIRRFRERIGGTWWGKSSGLR